MQISQRLVSNYERVKFTYETRAAIRLFACLLIFAQRVDFFSCYISPKLKITDNVGTGVQKEMALFAGCQSYFPRKLRKRKFVPGEKDSSDPNERRQSRGKKGKQPFCSFGGLFGKGNLVPRRPSTSLLGEENQPRLIRKTSTLVTKMMRNSLQRDNQPVE